MHMKIIHVSIVSATVYIAHLWPIHLQQICICSKLCLFYMAILVDNTQLLLCSIKLEVILTLKVIVSFFSYNTQRRNLEELLQVSRDKVASGFTDEIKGTSCLQNKLLELQVSQPSSFKNIFLALIVIFSCRALTFYALCVLSRDTEHP